MANPGIFTSNEKLAEQGLQRKGGAGGLLGEIANIFLPSKYDFDVYEDIPQKTSGVAGVQVEVPDYLLQGDVDIPYRTQQNFEQLETDPFLAVRPEGELPQNMRLRPSMGYSQPKADEMGKYQLYSSSGRRSGTTNTPLNPTQQYFATVGRYIENNPNATQADISRFKREQRGIMSRSLRNERIEELENNPTWRKNTAARNAQKLQQNQKTADAMGIINIPKAEELHDMSYMDLRKMKILEKDKIQEIMEGGYSESEAIEILADKWTLKDKLKKLKLKYLGTGKNLDYLRRH